MIPSSSTTIATDMQAYLLQRGQHPSVKFLPRGVSRSVVKGGIMVGGELCVGGGIVFTAGDDVEVLEAILSWYKENLGTLHAITFNYCEDGKVCWAVVWYEK